MGPFGTVAPPPGLNQFDGGNITGLPLFLNVLLRTLIMGASVYALFNFVLAGYAYLSAGGDPAKIQNATSKITQTIVGLVIAAGSFVIAAIIGQLFFEDYGAILNVKIFGP